MNAAAEVLERIALANLSDPATDDLTVPLAIELADARIAVDRITAERDAARAAAIEECAKLLDQWAKDAAEFGHNERCKLQHNVCRSAAGAIRHLATLAVSDAESGGGR